SSIAAEPVFGKNRDYSRNSFVDAPFSRQVPSEQRGTQPRPTTRVSLPARPGRQHRTATAMPTALLIVPILTFLIFVHELGHYTMARRAGVKVEEFGFGLPPRLWGIQRGETLWSINWIPLGGFVRVLG